MVEEDSDSIDDGTTARSLTSISNTSNCPNPKEYRFVCSLAKMQTKMGILRPHIFETMQEMFSIATTE